MKPENFEEAKWLKRIKLNMSFPHYRNAYLDRHPSFLKFNFPKYFYFKILNDRCAIHWAVIREENNKFIIYFIDINGRAFDQLEFKTKKQAQRALRRNKFYFSTNKRCPYMPINPIYVRLGKGKKSAPYSLGNLWNFYKKTQHIIEENIQKGMSIPESVTCMVQEHTELFSRKRRKNWNKSSRLIKRHMEEIEKEKLKMDKKKSFNDTIEYLTIVISIIFIITLILTLMAGW